MRTRPVFILTALSLFSIACQTPETARKDMLREARVGCDRGNASACFHAGQLCAETHNAERSQAAFAKACSLKHAASCDALAAITGPKRESVLAEACSGGDLLTCTRLADVYPKDAAGLSRGRALLEQVCRAASAVSSETRARDLHGAAAGCAKLATFYTNGQAKADPILAMRLDTLATMLYTEALFQWEKQEDASLEKEIAARPANAAEKDRSERETDASRQAYEAFLQSLDAKVKTASAEEIGSAKKSSPVSLVEEVFGASLQPIPRSETGGTTLDDASHCKETGDSVSCAIAAAQITDPAAALQLHLAGCAKRPDQCWSLVSHAESALRKRDAKAREALEKGCELKAANACVRLGLELEEGERGVPQDMAKAAKAYEKACDAGNARACLMLAALAEDGRGTARNPARAKQLHTKADGLDNPPRKPPPSTETVASDEQACRSQRTAERCLSAGAGTQDTDAVKAEELYRIGCTANRQTCGLWTFAIERFRRDDASRGLRLLDQGCQESSPQACLVLAEVQHLGYRSVPRAEARAAELYQKACELGDAFSCRVTAARFRGVKQTAKADELRDKAVKLDEEADRRGDSDRWARDAVDARTRGPHAQELARALAEWRMLADAARSRAQARAKRLEMAYTGHRLPPVPPFSKEDVDASAAREGSIRRSVPGLFSASK